MLGPLRENGSKMFTLLYKKYAKSIIAHFIRFLQHPPQHNNNSNSAKTAKILKVVLQLILSYRYYGINRHKFLSNDIKMKYKFDNI